MQNYNRDHKLQLCSYPEPDPPTIAVFFPAFMTIERSLKICAPPSYWNDTLSNTMSLWMLVGSSSGRAPGISLKDNFFKKIN